MSELPNHWASAKLSELAEVIMGQSPPSNTYNKSNVGLPFFQGKAEFGKLFPTPIKYCSEPIKIAKTGDILISVRAPVGPTNLCVEDSCIGRGLAAIRPMNCILSLFILFYLRSIEDLIANQGTGSTFTQISKADLAQLNLPVPPLNEQRRIVAKLEKLWCRVNAAEERLASIFRILNRFRQSVLKQACTGLLTVNWRASEMDVGIDPCSEPSSDRSNGSEIAVRPAIFPKTWDVRKFGSVISSIRGGSTAVPQNELTQFPILRSSSVRPGWVDLDDVKYVQSRDSENISNYLSEGDLLFTRLSGSLDYVANCAMVRGLNDKRIQYPDRLFCARMLPQMSTSFYELVFASPLIRSQITEHAKSSAGHQRVSIRDITNQVVPVPCLAEQQEIVNRVQTLFKTADALEARYLKAKAHVDKLTQSILAKAFRGELVPQDPNDEPASALLERISQSRVTNREKKKRSFQCRTEQ